MKVNDSMILNKLYMNKDPFTEGDLLEGKVLEIIDDIALIEIKDLGIIKAFTQEDLNHQKGKMLTFIVKCSLPSKIELKPILNNIEYKKSLEFINEPKDYLTNILKEFHVKDDPISIEFLDSLIKYNVKMDKENMVGGIKILDKLEQILNLDKDQIVILANPEKEILNIGKEDIRNFIIIDKEENKDKTDLKSIEKIEPSVTEKEDLTPSVKEYLIKSSLDSRIDSDMIKTISLFIKFNIKPTLNNIKYFLQLKEDPGLFSEDFKVLEKIAYKKFTNLDKTIIINRGSPKNLIEESNNKYKQTLDKIKELLKDDISLIDKSTKKTIEELRNKIELLDEINKELTFVYLPLRLYNDNPNSVITLLKNRGKKSGSNNKINVFINLKTKRLGNIKISCEILNSTINIKFNDIDKEDLNLFISRENELKALVKATGYEIRSIEYFFEKNYNILDSLIVNTKPVYYLDVQV